MQQLTGQRPLYVVPSMVMMLIPLLALGGSVSHVTGALKVLVILAVVLQIIGTVTVINNYLAHRRGVKVLKKAFELALKAKEDPDYEVPKDWEKEEDKE